MEYFVGVIGAGFLVPLLLMAAVPSNVRLCNEITEIVLQAKEEGLLDKNESTQIIERCYNYQWDRK